MSADVAMRLRFGRMGKVEAEDLAEIGVKFHQNRSIHWQYADCEKELPAGFLQGMYILEATRIAGSSRIGLQLLPAATDYNLVESEDSTRVDHLKGGVACNAFVLLAMFLTGPDSSALLVLPDERKQGNSTVLRLDRVLQWLAGLECTSAGGALLDARDMLDDTAYAGADVQLHGITERISPDGSVLSAERAHDE